MHRPADARLRRALIRAPAAILAAALALGLGWAVLSLPEPATGLTGRVNDELANSGVSHPVTAVLLNFRGYDTLLEIGVLLLALVGVWSLRLSPAQRDPEAARTPVLGYLVRLLVPGILIVTVYLLWAGSKQPGGAFQAGAVLAAAGELLLLAGFVRGYFRRAWVLRLTLAIGFGTFLAVAGGVMLLGNDLLQYPEGFAYPLILLIEGALTVSIGFTLAALFFGSPPEAVGEEER
ncbi:MAG: Na(+)/H(+) antiporter subunit B [Rubrobacteraceae bacterium]